MKHCRDYNHKLEECYACVDLNCSPCINMRALLGTTEEECEGDESPRPRPIVASESNDSGSEFDPAQVHPEESKDYQNESSEENKEKEDDGGEEDEFNTL